MTKLKKIAITIAATILATAPGLAQTTGDRPDYPTAERPPSGDAFPVQRIDFPDGIQATADVIYRIERGFRPLTMDVYRDPSVNEARPAILYIHGGAWQESHKRAAGVFTDFPGVLADLASRGYVTASAEYRLSGEAPFPAAAHDVQAAIRHLRDNAEDYGIDPDRIAIWGSSAGGHLASLAAVTCENGSLARYSAESAETSGCVAAAAIWYGFFDAAHADTPPTPALERGAFDRFLGCDPGACPGYLIEAASPIAHVDGASPPFLLVHGEDDRVVPISQSRAFEERLIEAGVSVETHYVPDVNHSFMAPDPALTRETTLVAVQRTFRFFDEQLLDQ